MSPAYAYRAVEPGGRTIRGSSEANSSEALVRSLEERGLFVLAVDSSQPVEATSTHSISWRGRSRSVLQLTRALAALLPTNMPLPRALAAAARVAGEPVATALTEVQRRVERGESLAAALVAHPRLFRSVYTGVVRAGEKSGDLSSAFARLADLLERQEKLRARLLSASIYPLILAALGGLSVIVLLLFVIPRFADLLEGAGASLPGSTAFLLGVSSTLRAGGPLILLGLAAAALGLVWFIRNEEGKRVRSAILDRVPLAGALRSDLLAGRYARLVGALLGGGAPLLAALEDAEGSLADPGAREEAERIRRQVREGSSFHAALDRSGFFPDLLGQLVAIGEESG
ncbi:MAG: type II secretion system F family protein, partial [Gemmatimonadota bacterium]